MTLAEGILTAIAVLSVLGLCLLAESNNKAMKHIRKLEEQLYIRRDEKLHFGQVDDEITEIYEQGSNRITRWLMGPTGGERA